ncbi:protein kinase NEK family HsNEK1-like protein [Leptomonas seymouri]|uniref:non-specific serine/threonine protein kinase n=1 Tax=Leptomonas seymouri TaxID=5684 RepID=A0A0N1I5W3_LEPSE|nr:protein kinase NEK family HsNEK1-like protein [Leptomonas seymouri]|eukprot:KPI88263.1 protein kinase NEK family HsNEK1-like protein [Leptomonas seymouri]
MNRADLGIHACHDRAWKWSPQSHLSKKTYLNEVLPRLFLLFPFYNASSTFSRKYNLGGRVNARQLGVDFYSQELKAAALYPPAAQPRGTIQCILGVGAGGIVLLAEQYIVGQRNAIHHHSDSSFTVTDASPLLASVSLPPWNTSSRNSENNIVTSSTSSGAIFHHDGCHVAVAKFALKFIPLEGASRYTIEHCLREVQVLRCCNFFSIMKVYRSYVTVRSEVTGVEETIDMRDGISARSDITAVAMELEYLNCGDLRAELETRASQRPRRFFSQRNILLIFVQLVMALHYLHNRHNTLHRDIKAANVILSSNGLVKLADFGFSKPYQVPDGVRTACMGSFCGTPQYMAPEVWSAEPYGEKADMFSLGVLLFEMMEMRRPFSGPSIESIRRSILNCQKKPPHFENDMYCWVLRVLVMRLLDNDPSQRPSALQILAMPLMRETIGTLLGIVYRSTVSLTSSGDDTNKSGVALNAALESDGGGVLSTSPRPPLHTTSRTSSRTSSSKAFSISGQDRGAILADVRGVVDDIVSYLVQPGRAPTTRSSSQFTTSNVSGSLPPLVIPSSVSHDVPVAPSPSSTTAARRDDVLTTVMSGPLLKESSKGEWKRRYLQLVRRDLKSHSPSTALAVQCSSTTSTSYELHLSASQSSREQGGHMKVQQLNGYIDCYPMGMDEYNGFALQSDNGSSLRFICKTSEEQGEWVDALLTSISRQRCLV